MIILQSNQELKTTYEKLIRTMGERVEWNGRFVMIDNYLILQGEVRSLFFNFENRKVMSNIIDLTVQEEFVQKIEDYPKLQNIINMTLYAFGKWGTIKGIRVDQDYQQLNQIFDGILQEYQVEPGFTKENYRFYQKGIRITYEDMVQIAIEAAKKPVEESDEEKEEQQGLWHKLVWKKQTYSFQKVETTLAERQKERLGHNFYRVGYLCPKCQNKLDMVVYPVGKEQQIETDEGSVFLARAYTCSPCNCFYTPLPERLIQEGSVYEMTFGSDRVAYEDYLELLGEKGERTSNYNYNEYAVVHKQKKKEESKRRAAEEGNENEVFENADAAWLQMEAMCRRLSSMPEQELNRFLARIEDGFYPDVLLERHEEQIARQVRARKQVAAEPKKNDTGKAATVNESNVEQKPSGQNISTAGNPKSMGAASNTPTNEPNSVLAGKPQDAGAASNTSGNRANSSSAAAQTYAPATGQNSSNIENPRYAATASNTPATGSESPTAESQNNPTADRLNAAAKPPYYAATVSDIQMNEPNSPSATPQNFTKDSPESEREKQFRARISMWERLSPRQRQELKSAIEREKQLTEQTRGSLLAEIKQLEETGRIEQLREKVKACEGKPYGVIRRVLEEVEDAQIPGAEKAPLLEQLKTWLNEIGTREVEALVRQMPRNLDRARFKNLMKKIRTYEGVDLSPYEKELSEYREAAEGQEAANLVKRARKKTRADLTDLMKRMEAADFEPETLAPYMEELSAQLEEADRKAIDEICDDVMHMDFNEAVDAYEKIEEGNFLPQLKTDALEMLSKRLAKIKADECEALVQKFKDDMEGKIRPNEKHYFYPARKVLMKNATKEETEVIDYALATYAGNRGLFEYPILVVDTSRNGSGREGMILTPEHLFTSTMLNAYYVPIKDIKSIKSSTGLLNKGIWAEQKNGTKIKIPFAVENDEIRNWAEVLKNFISYLQEKPESRNLPYLAKETHDTICCFRCGHVYQGGSVCPECGYKSNK